MPGQPEILHEFTFFGMPGTAGTIFALVARELEKRESNLKKKQKTEHRSAHNYNHYTSRQRDGKHARGIASRSSNGLGHPHAGLGAGACCRHHAAALLALTLAYD